MGRGLRLAAAPLELALGRPDGRRVRDPGLPGPPALRERLLLRARPAGGLQVSTPTPASSGRSGAGSRSPTTPASCSWAPTPPAPSPTARRACAPACGGTRPGRRLARRPLPQRQLQRRRLPRARLQRVHPPGLDTTFTGLRRDGQRLSVFCRDVIPTRRASRRDEVALFWFDLYYAKRLRPTNNPLDFRSPDTAGAVGYGLGPFCADHRVRPARHVRSARPAAHHGIRGARHHRRQGRLLPRRRRVAASLPGLPASNLRRPEAIQRVASTTCAAPANGADYVVLAYDDFMRAGAAPGAASRHGVVGRAEPAHAGGPDLRRLRLVLGRPHRPGRDPQLLYDT